MGGRGNRVTPPLREAADLQTKLWLGDCYETQLETAEREGDPGALACLRGNRSKVFPFDAAAFSKALMRRATMTREWLQFLEKYPVVLMPVSGELPFPDQLDRRMRPPLRGCGGRNCRRSLFPSCNCLRYRSPRDWWDGFPLASNWFQAASARICACWRGRPSKPAARRRRRSIPCTDRIQARTERARWLASTISRQARLPAMKFP